MSTKFVHYFKFISFSIALYLVTSFGYSSHQDMLDTDLQRKLVGEACFFCQSGKCSLRTPKRGEAQGHLLTESDVKSFGWHITRETQNTIICDQDGTLVATIFTLKRGANAGKLGLYFNVQKNMQTFQHPFDDMPSAQKCVVRIAREHNISLARCK